MTTLQVPHSIPAEQAVLGSILLDNNTWHEVSTIIKPSDFYINSHRSIFSEIKLLIEKRIPVDIITLSEYLAKTTESIQNVHSSYIYELVNNTGCAENVLHYAEIVREHAIMRQLISTGTKMRDLGYKSNGKNSRDIIAAAEKAMFDLSQRANNASEECLPIREILTNTLIYIDDIGSKKEGNTGISTGFTELDKYTGGLQPSDLIIIAGRPSMGKSTIALNIGEHAAKNNVPVAFFSIEMSGRQLAIKLLSSMSGVRHYKVKHGKLNKSERELLNNTAGELSNTPFFIDTSPSLSTSELRSKARRLKNDANIGLIIIDYLQLMQSSTDKSTRAEEIGEISRTLKAIAKEINVPVIALSQLNRGLESRQCKVPLMSDLRESGAIEQDADIILFIYRDEVYNSDSKQKGLADLIIGKQRNGPTGTLTLKFDGKLSRFTNL